MRISTLLKSVFRSKAAKTSFLAAFAAVSWATASIDLATVSDVSDAGTGWGISVADAEEKAGTKPADTKKADTSGGSESATAFANAIIAVIQIIFLPATMLAGWLLSPDWTFGQIFGLRPVLHNLWILISNVVYAIFAFILVAIAFMNIFGAWQEHYAIKKALPRFAVGILIVPFTWFAVSAILSVSNVLTASVLRLPADVISQQEASNIKFKVPAECTLNFDKTGSDSDKKVAPGEIFTCKKETEKPYVEMTIADLLKSQKGAYGILNVYSYDVFQVQRFKDITADSLKGVSGILDLVIHLGVWVIFLFIYALLVIALCFALFTRAVYLWLIAIFSPLFGLFYFFGGHGKLSKDFEDKLWFKTFVSLALVPVYVSAALGFGLLFLKMVSNTEIKPENSSFFSNGTASATADGATFVLGWQEGKTSEFIVKGIPVGAAKDKDGNLPGLAGSAIGKIIISVLGLVVLWMSVMTALKSSTITEQAISPIADFGKSMGGLLKDLPKHTPIPLPGGHKVSMTGLQTMGTQISQTISSASAQSWSTIGRNIGEGIAGRLWMQMSEASKHMQKIAAETKPAQTAIEAGRQIQSMLSYQGASLKSLFEDVQAKSTLANRVNSFPDSVIKPEVRKKISEAITSARTEEDLAIAFKDLEHALGGPNLGGGWIELNTKEGVDNWLKSLGGQSTTPASQTAATTTTTIKPVISGSKITVATETVDAVVNTDAAGKTTKTLAKAQFDSLVSAAARAHPDADKGTLEKNLKVELEGQGVTVA